MNAVQTIKRDDLDGKAGGKHYTISNYAVACFEKERKVVRNRIICPACGAKWGTR